MDLKIENKGGKMPFYATEGAAGFDLCAYLPQGDVCLKPGKRALVPTGIAMEIPAGYEGQVRARSGLALKYGIGLVNGVGTVDADYRGEIAVPLINWGEEEFLITDGMRIAQMVITACERVNIVKAELLSETARSNRGFGSTGR